jgi:hypothetical protein
MELNIESRLASEVYVWTEALGCAEILGPMLRSYVTHNNHLIHVYVYEEEMLQIPVHKNIQPVAISFNSPNSSLRREITEGYKQGHLGTARLWSHIIKNIETKYFIHLDADSIFLNEVVDILSEKVHNYGVVGSRRPYRLNSVKRTIRNFSLRWMPDSVNTHCFAFKNTFLDIEREDLTELILARNQTTIKKIFRPVIDFFDPVTFHLRKNYGIHYLDSFDQKRSGEYSRYGDFESRMISFSAVGSGCAFYKGKSIANSKTYEKFAISSFALYSKYLLGEVCEAEPLASEYLEGLLKKLDTNSWRIADER